MTLKDTREAAGLTQRDLAKLARVCRASISHIEHERYAPTARFAGKVCRALSTALDCTIHTWQLFPDHFRALTAAGAGEADPPAPCGRGGGKRAAKRREVRA